MGSSKASGDWGHGKRKHGLCSLIFVFIFLFWQIHAPRFCGVLSPLWILMMDGSIWVDNDNLEPLCNAL
jgi:hypothetical protein